MVGSLDSVDISKVVPCSTTFLKSSPIPATHFCEGRGLSCVSWKILTNTEMLSPLPEQTALFRELSEFHLAFEILLQHTMSGADPFLLSLPYNAWRLSAFLLSPPVSGLVIYLGICNSVHRIVTHF